MFLLTLRDLQFRRLRFVVVSVLAGVVFTLLFLMTGLVEQFNREPFEAVDAMNSTGWVVAEGANSPFTAASTMPADTIDSFSDNSPVPAVVGRATLVAPSIPDGQQVILIGAPIGERVDPELLEGRPVGSAGELVLDQAAEVPLGTSVDIGGAAFTVVGISDRTTLFAGIPMGFVDLVQAQQLVFGSEQVISTLFINGRSVPIVEGTSVRSDQVIAADALTPLDGAIGSVNLIRILLWIVAAVIIGAVVYLSALERSRDFAVLKAVGATNRDLVIGLAMQAALIALIAVAIAAVLQALIQPVFPLRVQVPARAFWQVPLVAVIASMVSAAGGMRKVAGSDPAKAFAGGAA